MRLLKFEPGDKYRLVDFIGRSLPPYAILSHTWGLDSDELQFDDIIRGTSVGKPGYYKLQFLQRQALRDGLEYGWMDTCCINKANFTELSEAINSMFMWYSKADRCYAYMIDVFASSPTNGWLPEFKRSRWFNRGWTLQELIALPSVEFFSSSGERLGNKATLEQVIFEVTSVPITALRGGSLAVFTPDERMSWSNNRQTRLSEDAVYCMLGIFDIHMPLIYGEGRYKAMSRLREEVSKSKNLGLPVAQGASFDSHEEEHNSICLADTRVQLRQDIEEWASASDDKHIFWLSGAAGTGKSTVARTMAHSFADQGKLGASFLFKRGAGDRSTARKFVTTIAQQLVLRIPVVGPGIVEASRRSPDIGDKRLKEQFATLIAQPIDLLRATDLPEAIIIVVDALDECEREEDIHDMNSDFVDQQTRIAVRLGFKKLSADTYEKFVLHEISPTTVVHDLLAFLKHRFDNIREEHEIEQTWPSNAVLEELAQLSVPLFIFAATVCRFIESVGHPKTQLARILSSVTSSTASRLHRTYAPILERLLVGAGESDRSRILGDFCDVIGSLVMLERPLPMIALAALLQKDSEDISYLLRQLHSVLHVTSIPTEPVRLCHLSFREFLLDTEEESKYPLSVDSRTTHAKLAERCLKLLVTSPSLKQDICNKIQPSAHITEFEPAEVTRILPDAVQYACLYWVCHLKESMRNESCTFDFQLIEVFFKHKFLCWFEALGLMRHAKDLVAMIESLQAIPQVRRDWSSCVQTLEGHEISICDVKFSPDGTLLASGSEDGVINLWDALTGSLHHTLNEPTDKIHTLSFSKDGKAVLYGMSPRRSASNMDFSNRPVVKIWHFSTNTISNIGSPSLIRGFVRGSSFGLTTISPHRLTAAHSHDRVLRLVRMYSLGTEVKEYEVKKVKAYDWKDIVSSGDGHFLAILHRSDKISIHDTESGTQQCMFDLDGSNSMVTSLVLGPKAVYLNYGTYLQILTLADGKLSGRYDITRFRVNSDRITAMAVSPWHRTLACLGREHLLLWNTQTANVSSVFEAYSACSGRAPAFSADGLTLAVPSVNNTVDLYDAFHWSGTGVASKLRNTQQINDLAVSPDMKKVMCGFTDGQLKLYDTRGGTLQYIWKSTSAKEHSIFMVSVSSNEKMVASLAASPNAALARFWDAKTGTLHGVTSEHLNTRSIVTFSRSGSRIALVAADGSVLLLSTSTWHYNVLQRTSYLVTVVAISPDESFLAVGCTDHSFQVWTLAGDVVHTMTQHQSDIIALTFSLDGQMLVTKDLDAMFIIWDVAQGKSVQQFRDRSLPRSHSVIRDFYDLAVSPDKTLLAGTARSGNLGVWSLHSHELLVEIPTKNRYLNLAFSPDGHMLCTNQGLFHVRPTSNEIPIGRLQGLSLQNEWVCWNGQRILWLPKEYCSATHVVTRTHIFIGSESGALHTLDFDVAKLDALFDDERLRQLDTDMAKVA